MDDDELQTTGYSDAPGWYWRIAFRLGGWRGEVLLWASMLVLGLIIGYIGGTLT